MCCSRRHAIFFPDSRCQLEKTGKFYLFLLFITSAENLLTSSLLHSSYSTSTQHSHVLAKVSPNQVEENDMFRILARYIGVFGNPENKDTNKIAMTAPVLSTKTSSSKIAMTAPVLSSSANDMRFVLPKKFKTKEDAPQPTDTRVELIDVPERMVAVKTFSGLVSMDQSETMANEFKAALEAQGFICKGTFTNLVLEFEHKLQLTRINFFSFSLVLFVFFFDLLYLRRLDVGEIQSAFYVVVSSYKRNMDDS